MSGEKHVKDGPGSNVKCYNNTFLNLDGYNLQYFLVFRVLRIYLNRLIHFAGITKACVDNKLKATATFLSSL